MRVVEVRHRRGETPRPVDSFSRLRLEGVTDLDEVRAVLASVQAEGPHVRAFVTLDEAQQCLYTSLHAREHEAIELPVDLRPDLTAEEWGDPVHLRRYDEVQLHHVVSRLEEPGRRVGWGALGADLDDDAGEALLAANAEPALLLDDTVHVQQPPVERDDLLLAALPNGYFDGDLDVFANHAIVRRLQERHGYRFLGLGAAWLGFERDRAPAPDEAALVVADLQVLYGTVEEDWTALVDVLAGTSALLVGYAQRFSDSVLETAEADR